MKDRNLLLSGKSNKDRRIIDTNAKYDNLFDRFGNRIDNLITERNNKPDPLAGSKERRKNRLKIVEQQDTDYSPMLIRDSMPSRRLYKGVYK